MAQLSKAAVFVSIQRKPHQPSAALQIAAHMGLHAATRVCRVEPSHKEQWGVPLPAYKAQPLVAHAATHGIGMGLPAPQARPPVAHANSHDSGTCLLAQKAQPVVAHAVLQDSGTILPAHKAQPAVAHASSIVTGPGVPAHKPQLDVAHAVLHDSEMGLPAQEPQPNVAQAVLQNSRTGLTAHKSQPAVAHVVLQNSGMGVRALKSRRSKCTEHGAPPLKALQQVAPSGPSCSQGQTVECQSKAVESVRAPADQDLQSVPTLPLAVRSMEPMTQPGMAVPEARPAEAVAPAASADELSAMDRSQHAGSDVAAVSNSLTAAQGTMPKGRRRARRKPASKDVPVTVPSQARAIAVSAG